MINPFSHIQDILNRSSKEAARTLGREISVEHLMLSLISQNDSDVNKLLKGADISPMAFCGVLNSKLEKHVEETPADNVKENSHIPFSQITDSIIRDSIREANNYEHSKIVEPRHLLLAILRNDKNPVANWLSQLGLSYDRAIEMLYPTDKDDEQKTEEPKDFKMEPQTPDSETPAADRQEEAENLEMADFVRGSHEDFGILYKKPEADKVYNAEISFYCKKFICTQGAEPVEVRAENGFAKSYPSEKMKPVSTIGAGDNFNAGFVFGLIKDGITREDIDRGLSEAQWDSLLVSAQEFSTECCKDIYNYVSKEFGEEKKKEL